MINYTMSYETATRFFLITTAILMFTISLFSVLFALAYPWDDPVLDMRADTDTQYGFKQNEITVTVESCDSIKNSCHYKNRIAYVDFTIDIYDITDEDNPVFVETFESNTRILGIISYPIFIDEKYGSHSEYQIIVTGYHEDQIVTKSMLFWTQEKNY